jgi:hypothetical protein
MPEIKRILVATDMSTSAALAKLRTTKRCRYFGLLELELVKVQDAGFVDMPFGPKPETAAP